MIIWLPIYKEIMNLKLKKIYITKSRIQITPQQREIISLSRRSSVLFLIFVDCLFLCFFAIYLF
jgi:hypothetical protein